MSTSAKPLQQKSRVPDAEVRVNFTNDYCQPPVDRNLFLDKVTVVCGGAEETLVADINIFTDWGAGYCASLEVTNNGDSPTTGWAVVIDTLDSDIPVLEYRARSGCRHPHPPAHRLERYDQPGNHQFANGILRGTHRQQPYSTRRHQRRGVLLEV